MESVFPEVYRGAKNSYFLNAKNLDYSNANAVMRALAEPENQRAFIGNLFSAEKPLSPMLQFCGTGCY